MKWIVMFVLCLECTAIFAAKDEGHVFDPATLRATLRFAVEVPFNNVAANTVSKGSNVTESLMDIFSLKGVLGFYAGGSMEAARSLLWYPRMWIIQQGATVSEELIPFTQATGVSALEAAAMPLFRVRTAMMVESKARFRRELYNVLRTAYSGTWLRSTASWVSWFVYFETDAWAKHNFQDNHLVAGVLTASSQLAVAAMTSPNYVVLINRQKLTEPCDLPFVEAVCHHYKCHGFTIFYRTAKLGAAHLVLQAALTTLVTGLFTDEKKGDSMQN
jgi:hypothetical protein